MGLALWLLAVQRVQSYVRAKQGKPVGQALGAPLWCEQTHLQDAEDSKKD
jgi:hypothetical protein